jgi:putative phosphoribosyl transferase
VSAPFRDRREAGQLLALALASYADRLDVVVLALPRGGVPVAAEVAHRLRTPLEVFLVRKLGAPGHPELAVGAIAAGGVRVLNQDVIAGLDVSPAVLQRITALERIELERRDTIYRGDRARRVLGGMVAIVVDDGLATGSTMEAAVAAVREQGVAKAIVAVPVGARDSCRRLRGIADEVVCLETPEPFRAVGCWYEDFNQTSDAEVIELLRASGSEASR